MGDTKMVYIDPPNNTRNDFTNQDDFKQPAEAYGEQLRSMQLREIESARYSVPGNISKRSAIKVLSMR